MGFGTIFAGQQPHQADRHALLLVSGGREPPPPALVEPYVTVSRHTAPTDRRRVIETSCQWANIVGSFRFTAVSAVCAWPGLPRNRLYLCMAHRTRCSSMRRTRENNSEW